MVVDVRRRYPFVRVGRHRHAQVRRRGVEDPFHLHHGVRGQFTVDEERGGFVVGLSLMDEEIRRRSASGSATIENLSEAIFWDRFRLLLVLDYDIMNGLFLNRRGTCD